MAKVVGDQMQFTYTPKGLAEQTVAVEFKTPNEADKASWPAVHKSQKFQNWVEHIALQAGQLVLKKITIQAVDMFGDTLGFVKLNADIENASGAKLPGVVFLRGDSVVVLISLRAKHLNDDYCVLVKQARAPAGVAGLYELPAGMLDEAKKFSEAAVKEIEEETGIKVSEGELIDMTELAYGRDTKGVTVSPGGSDERLRVFLHRKSLTQEEMNGIDGKTHESGITVKLAPIRDVWRLSPDAKTLAALQLFQTLRAARRIPLYRQPASAITKTPPLFKKVATVQPQDKGLNLLVKVTVVAYQEEITRGIKLVQAQVADETGAITIRLRTEQADPLKTLGSCVVIRNCKIAMYQGKMRIEVDQWGKITAAEDDQKKDFEVNTSNDMSAVEYELVEIELKDPKNAVPYNNNYRGGGNFGGRGRGGFRGGRGGGRFNSYRGAPRGGPMRGSPRGRGSRWGIRY